MKIIFKIFKSLLFGLVAIVLVTIGIDAADHYDNMSESIVGKIISSENGSVCPEDMAFVASGDGGFCIDLYEASPGEKCEHKDPSNQNETRLNLNNEQCFPVSAKGKSPWRFISQDQAALACAKAGKRLPTNEEWYKAALGTPDALERWGVDDCQVDNNWISQPGSTGSGSFCRSSAGVYDMVGNVWEWVEGAAWDGQYDQHELPDSGYIESTDGVSMPAVTSRETPNINYNNDYFWIKKNGVRGMARGGYWDNKSDGGVYSMYIVSQPSDASAGTGFRCAK